MIKGEVQRRDIGSSDNVFFFKTHFLFFAGEVAGSDNTQKGEGHRNNGTETAAAGLFSVGRSCVRRSMGNKKKNGKKINEKNSVL